MTSDEDSIREHMPSLFSEERPITVDEACSLRIVLFGQTSKSFKYGWIKQGFKFRVKPSYGLQQLHCGPCGILAAVQAHILYQLLYGNVRLVLDADCLKPNAAERREALARSLASILWKAGDRKEVIVAKKCVSIKLDDDVTTDILARDGLLEYVALLCFNSQDSLLEYFYNYIPLLMKEGGCILFMYSLLLTRGIERIKQEMGDPDSHLIGEDEFCSQEIVNLILTGKASSYLFDGQLHLNSEGSALMGISEQSRIGFLCLYDLDDNAGVGSHFKDPETPIWVVYGQLHFSVLFGTSRNILKKTSDSFKLFYYDGLAKYRAEKSYVIKPNGKLEEDENTNRLPVAIRCMLTRWPLALIEDTEVDSDFTFNDSDN